MITGQAGLTELNVNLSPNPAKQYRPLGRRRRNTRDWRPNPGDETVSGMLPMGRPNGMQECQARR
jgi:hypothetical protein